MQAEQYRVENNLDGQLWIFDRHNGAPVFKFDPKTGDAFVGGQTYRGRIMVQTADDGTTIMLDGATGTVETRHDGKTTIRLDGPTGNIGYTGTLEKLG